MTIAVDLVASQLVMSYWFPDTPGWIWSALFLGIMFLLNWISVRGFGEAEYWFSLIKVATVIIFIIVGIMMIFGIFEGAKPAGWSNWGIDDAPFAGGFAAMIGVAMIVGFSFRDRAHRYCRGRIGKSGEEHSARGASGVLAYPAVLCLRDFDYQPDHPVYRSEPAAQRR